MTGRVPDAIRVLARIDGEHLAKALVATSADPDWVDEVLAVAPPEVLRDALRHLTVDWFGRVLGDRR